MKANQKQLRKIVHDIYAVSPVIAVILMVAITVVLSATVFVLVQDLGGDVGKSGPKLSLVTDTTSSTSKWIVKVSDATQSSDLTDYQFVLSTPKNGTIVVDPDSNSFDSGTYGCVSDEVTGTARYTATCAATGAHVDADADYLLKFVDVSGDGKFNTLDQVVITYDTDGVDSAAPDTFPTGAYKLELRHKTSGTMSGASSQGF